MCAHKVSCHFLCGPIDIHCLTCLTWYLAAYLTVGTVCSVEGCTVQHMIDVPLVQIPILLTYGSMWNACLRIRPAF